MSLPRIITKHFINGQFVKSINGKTFPVYNPSDQKLLAQIQKGSPEDIDLAVKAARDAFDNGIWRKMTPTARGNCLFKLADLVNQNKHQLGVLQSLDNGKPAHIATDVDVNMVENVFRYYAGWVDKIRGHTLPIDGPFFAYTKKQPVGVVGQIIPWNFPLVMLSWKLGPALAAGCTVVMKTAQQTPLTALRVAQLIKKAGIPDGVVNIVNGFGDIGSHLAKHPGIDKIAFTGSSQVGYQIMRNSHVNNLKRITLQLGGKSANIVTQNANLDRACDQATMALFFNAGQCCVAGSRTFVHASIYDKFVARTTQRIKAIKLGCPTDSTTQQGPLVSKQQMQRVLSYIDKGVKQGAKLMAGGKRYGSKGYYVEPTLFADVTDDMTIAKQQIFGPVMCIFKYNTNQQVIERANRSQFGLGAGINTQNISQMQWFTNRLKSGTVYGNCYNVLQKTLPFGGFKDSGIGRQLGQQGLNNYLQNKTVILRK